MSKLLRELIEMKLLEQYQKRIDEKILKLKGSYSSFDIYNVSEDFEIQKIDTLEHAVDLNPHFIIVEIEYTWKNFNYTNSTHDIIFLNSYTSDNIFSFKNWNINFSKTFNNYSVTGYYFRIADQIGFVREVMTKSYSIRGYKELFEYIKIVAQWNTWKEYDLFIENYQLRFDNLENLIENTWNRLLLTQDLNLLAEFSTLEDELRQDQMFNKRDSKKPSFFFKSELNKLSRRADFLYRLILIKKSKCLLAKGLELESNEILDTITESTWWRKKENEKFKETLELMIENDHELINKYFQID